jgi:phosphosulfolactate synthase (CoM biosynthesis protein A)
LEKNIMAVQRSAIKPRGRRRTDEHPGPSQHEASTSTPTNERAFAFLEINQRDQKPRSVGLTEIRGPYYTPMGRRYLEDLLETMGEHVDSLKFAGGSFALMSRASLQELIETAHRFQVEVSTGGFIEYVLTKGAKSVGRYIAECAELGFDTIEVSSGFITIPTPDWIRLIKKIQRAGLKAKPEVGIQYGAGGASESSVLEGQGTSSPQMAIERAKRFLKAGVSVIMIESEGITECVKSWRSDVPWQFANALGLEHVMFEAADPPVFSWYVKNFGPEVNLFVDHSQIVQLECLRRGIWGTADLWGKVVTFKG